MSSIKLESNASGTGIFTIASPNSNTNRTLTIPDATGTIITTAGGAAISGTTGAFTTTVGVGGATPAASGAGITFPATQSASSDANTLDDYEEGTFTPAFFISSTDNTTGTPVGRYTKIGNIVNIRGKIQILNTTSGSGTIEIRSLPFTSANIDANIPIAYMANDNINTSNLIFNIGNNSTKINIYINSTSTSGTLSVATNSIISSSGSGKYFWFSGTYEV